MDFLDIDDVPSFDDENFCSTEPMPRLSQLPTMLSPIPDTPPDRSPNSSMTPTIPQECIPRMPPTRSPDHSPLELLPWKLILLTLSPPKRRVRVLPPPTPLALLQPPPAVVKFPPATTPLPMPTAVTEPTPKMTTAVTTPTPEMPPQPKSSTPPLPKWAPASKKRCRRKSRLPDGRMIRFTKCATGSIRMGHIASQPRKV